MNFDPTSVDASSTHFARTATLLLTNFDSMSLHTHATRADESLGHISIRIGISLGSTEGPYQIGILSALNVTASRYSKIA